jgi:hypothetical protein
MTKKKKRVLGVVWVTVEKREKIGNGGNWTAGGGWWRCRGAGGGVSVVVGRCLGGGIWILGSLGGEL